MMKLLVISAVVALASIVTANVVVNQLNVEETAPVEKEVDVERQEGILPGLNTPPKQCKNATVATTDCTSIIVTRLPFLFNFRLLNRVCGCEDNQLKCDRGVGNNVFERVQIPALRSVYNLNCKCKCPTLVEQVVEAVETTTAAAL